MVGARVYDLMYRHWAPWDTVGVREDLSSLLDGGRLSLRPRRPGGGPRMRHRRQRGLPRPTGVPGDRGRLLPGRVGRRTRSGVRCGRHRRCRFVQADLTRDIATQLDGPYDLLVDFGTLGDLRPDGRRAMAANVRHLCRPDSELLLWCFYVSRDELPRISSRGPSRLSPGLEPGEEVQLFGDAFDIETVHAHRDGLPIACFLLTYRGPRAGAAPAQDG